MNDAVASILFWSAIIIGFLYFLWWLADPEEESDNYWDDIDD